MTFQLLTLFNANYLQTSFSFTFFLPLVFRIPSMWKRLFNENTPRGFQLAYLKRRRNFWLVRFYDFFCKILWKCIWEIRWKHQVGPFWIQNSPIQLQELDMSAKHDLSCPALGPVIDPPTAQWTNKFNIVMKSWK